MCRVRGEDVRASDGIAALAERLHPGKLWGHGLRGLVSIPVFALLPLLYLWLLAHSSGAASALWLVAFLLGFPHASYTALELRHLLHAHDGEADARTMQQAAFFGVYGLFGTALAVWYVLEGAPVLSQKLGLDARLTTGGLALAGSVGAVMGLQDVLVMDLLSRPTRVLRAGAHTLTRWRWLRVTLPWTALQLALASLVRAM